ncbi:hypothetical protein LCGC14_2068940 [marine sediment metagenome]|uniref:HNH endonuclease n=1 Tax=marine sediment metagenome TaxID=412755 RepID=A0A0F9F6B6_9ZZZZ
MPKFIDETGKRYGQLIVISRSKNSPCGRSAWTCVCSCGNTTKIQSGHLRSGKIRSCGCMRGQKHGMHRTPEYRAWSHMKERCQNSNVRGYRNYGGRGIEVCGEWINNFQAFYDHIGSKPSPKHSLDRIDNDGNYEPGNVRWATAKIQANNKRHGGSVPHDLYRLLTEPIVFTYRKGSA